MPGAVTGGISLGAGADIVTDTVTGASLGAAANQKTGLHGAKSVQAAAIVDVTGGTIIDVEARVAVNAILAALRGKGAIAT